MANRFERLSSVFLAGLIAVGTATFASAADADKGAELSQRWCSACHVVDASQRRASTDATPFRTIARAPGYDREKLINFLRDPHGMMPNMALSRFEAEDIAAYIETLAK
jgi:mono/diheme cytochrome c family protein